MPIAADSVPSAFYGVLERSSADSLIDIAVEQVRTLGYAVIDSGYNKAELQGISQAFDDVHVRYMATHGESKLRGIDEHCNIRVLLAQGRDEFRRLVFNVNLLAALRKLIAGKFVLNQQNGIINPANQAYNQGAWHRDLPYQHFVSSSPLAVNALFCVDDFTRENGATFVLPASHKSQPFPSENFVQRNATQVEASAGSFILLDCMLFHSGGFNGTSKARRAVNHVYNIPYFKQQINIPKNLDASAALSVEEQEILGYAYQEPSSVAEYLASRKPLKS